MATFSWIFKEGFMEEMSFELDLEIWLTCKKVLHMFLILLSAPLLTFFQNQTLFLPVWSLLHRLHQLSFLFTNTYSLFLKEAFCDSKSKLGPPLYYSNFNVPSQHQPWVVILHSFGWLLKLRLSLLDYQFYEMEPCLVCSVLYP